MITLHINHAQWIELGQRVQAARLSAVPWILRSTRFGKRPPFKNAPGYSVRFFQGYATIPLRVSRALKNFRRMLPPAALIVNASPGPTACFVFSALRVVFFFKPVWSARARTICVRAFLPV